MGNLRGAGRNSSRDSLVGLSLLSAVERKTSARERISEFDPNPQQTFDTSSEGEPESAGAGCVFETA
jgi:hypothetical protein